MADLRTQQVTRYLQRMQDGDSSAAEQLLPLLYGDLRKLANAMFNEQWRNHTLQPTALVHEAYLRLARAGDGPGFENRRHFLRVAALAMRQVLSDYARDRLAQKRSHQRRVELDAAGDDELEEPASAIDLVGLHEALEELEKLDERQARIVELRFLTGLTVPETAEVLGVSERTVYLDWNMARAWLEDHLA